MANAGVVPSVITNDHSFARDPSPGEGHLHPTPTPRRPLSPAQTIETFGMPAVWRQHESREVSQSTKEIMMASWRPLKNSMPVYINGALTNPSEWRAHGAHQDMFPARKVHMKVKSEKVILIQYERVSFNNIEYAHILMLRRVLKLSQCSGDVSLPCLYFIEENHLSPNYMTR